MAKYNVGERFQHKNSEVDSVDLEIIFVAPLDGYGVQHYLCTVLSGYNDGAEKMFLSLTTEKNIDDNFKFREQPFNWSNIVGE